MHLKSILLDSRKNQTQVVSQYVSTYGETIIQRRTSQSLSCNEKHKYKRLTCIELLILLAIKLYQKYNVDLEVAKLVMIYCTSNHASLIQISSCFLVDSHVNLISCMKWG